MNKYRLAFRYLRRHSYSYDDIRNLRLGAIVALYGIAFAIEKIIIHDWVWAIVYGIFAALSSFFWVEDAILDLWEDHNIEDDVLLGEDDPYIVNMFSGREPK